MSNSTIRMGERFIPTLPSWSEKSRQMFYGNYQWASQFVQDKIVLDCACGSGYGTDIIANTCKWVVGADVDLEIIRYAQENYKNKKIAFEVFSATAIPYPDNYFDLVLSFDTIEHVDDDEGMLIEVKRVTKEGGDIIISTPVGYFGREQGEENFLDPSHVREYSGYEWLALLSRHFFSAEIYNRDEHLNFYRIYPGDFLISSYDVSFVKVLNAERGSNRNLLDEVKERLVINMSHKIKSLEAELSCTKTELEKTKAELDKAPGNPLKQHLRNILKKFRM